MLATRRSQFVEKIITSPEGLDFRVVFLVFEEGGRIKARLVSATPISAPATNNNAAMALPGFAQSMEYAAILAFTWDDIIPSPYNSILRFTGSIPRGPNA
ncbi:MAG: hypothetical protein PHF79_04185 [Candidatus Pacebacteria bacterium]|nr:hypothetical protein [Candidatus Paceibacterota bacterium]